MKRARNKQRKNQKMKRVKKGGNNGGGVGGQMKKNMDNAYQRYRERGPLGDIEEVTMAALGGILATKAASKRKVKKEVE